MTVDFTRRGAGRFKAGSGIVTYGRYPGVCHDEKILEKIWTPNRRLLHNDTRPIMTR